VPNLNIVQGRGSSFSANVFIRGIGQPDALQTFDPGVGMYVDDVYYSRIQGALFSLFDVERIESCAARRARCTARTPPAARSSW
jgi:iron complex outermembrane receptor protein